ncbi:radical SAM protein [bacterium]|nr:radical SAM protein [bacterium]
MYSTKKFRVKDEDSVLDEIKLAAEMNPDTRRVFLADGDSMVLSTDRLLKILKKLKLSFPLLRRISCYASPGNLQRKTQKELTDLKNAGLKIIYTGIESGDDEVLKLVNKGETYSSTVEGLIKAREAGIKCSVMILNALGGKKYSRQHAINSAKLVNEVEPDYLSTLALMYSMGEEEYALRFGETYESMTSEDILEELKLFIAHTDLKRTVFRSDHASNYIFLRGVLGRDKLKLISTIDEALGGVDENSIREEWLRSL